MTPLHILANNSRRWPVHIIILVVLLALSGLKTLYEKYKESQERQQKEASGQGQPPVKPRVEQPEQQVRSVEEIVQTMRQARRPQQGQPRQPVPQARVAQQPRRREELADRHVLPSAVGQGVDAETGRLRRHLLRQQQQTVARVAGQPVGTLASMRGGEASRRGRTIVDIDPGELDEARRGILYSEILGPPIALRKQHGMWDI